MKIINACLWLSLMSSLAFAGGNPPVSSFFQDWQLDTSQANSATCAQTLSGYAGTDVPGANAMPSESLDSSPSLRFVPNDGEATEILTLDSKAVNDSILPSVKAKLSGGELSVPGTESFLKHLLGKKAPSGESYTLLPNGGLSYSDGKSIHCQYQSAHPDKVGMVEVGAILFNNGVQIASCTFLPASPRPDQINYVYHESCSFGKYTVKQVINDAHEVLSSELVANDQAVYPFEIVRSSSNLSTESENFLSRDTEIAVVDSNVDQVYPSESEYYISPLRTSTYALDGTHATVQLQYAPAQN